MGSAFLRAELVNDPHTQAYVCYYASVLYALRGDPAVAHQHAERCLTLSEEHGFRQWRGLSRAVRGICSIVLNPSSTTDQVITGLDEYVGARLRASIRLVAEKQQPEPSVGKIQPQKAAQCWLSLLKIISGRSYDVIRTELAW